MKDLTGQRPDRHTGAEDEIYKSSKKTAPHGGRVPFFNISELQKTVFYMLIPSVFLRLPCEPPFPVCFYYTGTYQCITSKEEYSNTFNESYHATTSKEE